MVWCHPALRSRWRNTWMLSFLLSPPILRCVEEDGVQDHLQTIRQIQYTAEEASPCGSQAFIEDYLGWRLLWHCGTYAYNNHYSIYYHESMVFPALASLGPKARRGLVFGGADGGVSTQLLQSPAMERVTQVSHDRGLTEACAKHMLPMSDGFEDQRLELVHEDPDGWLKHHMPGDSRESLPLLDLIVVDDLRPEDSPAPPPNRIRNLADLLAEHGALVCYGGTVFNLPRVQAVFNELRKSFKNVFVLHTATVVPEPWHDVFFVAGNSIDLLSMDWRWWRSQSIAGNAIFYNEAIHTSMLVPSVIVSRALGLMLPKAPDNVAVQRVNMSASQPVSLQTYAAALHRAEKPRQILQQRTPFQELTVHSHASGFTSMDLDGELQLTSLYGDFYHEALVHPAMAALGRRGRRVMVIGGGDGGVAWVALKYPGVEKLVHVEIDVAVVNVSATYFPKYTTNTQDPRYELIIGDAIEWVKRNAAEQKEGSIDLCVIDTTDNPLVSIFSLDFFHALKSLLSPHGAVIQNVGSMGDWLGDFEEMHAQVFEHTYRINCNCPDYPSPYYLSLLTDGLDPRQVDWQWWSSLGIDTMYYHPTLHDALMMIPSEVARYYLSGGIWHPSMASRAMELEQARAAAKSPRSEL